MGELAKHLGIQVDGGFATHVLVPQAGAKVPYDALRDFVPLANLFRSIKVLWVQPSLPVTTTNEWIGYVRARPGTVLHYYCTLHPWMQATIVVVALYVTAP